jgi:hypothetical protein
MCNCRCNEEAAESASLRSRLAVLMRESLRLTTANELLAFDLQQCRMDLRQCREIAQVSVPLLLGLLSPVLLACACCLDELLKAVLMLLCIS